MEPFDVMLPPGDGNLFFSQVQSLQQKEALAEVDKDEKAILDWAKQNLPPQRYAAFLQHMRRASNELCRILTEIFEINQSIPMAQAFYTAGRETLLAAAVEYDRNVLSYNILKDAVGATRQTNRAEVEDMSRQFGQLNVIDEVAKRHIDIVDPKDIDLTDPTRTFTKPQKTLKNRLTVLEGAPLDESESQNPVRDYVLSAATHLSITEVIAQFLPAKLPVYVAVASAHGAADGARIVAPAVEKISRDTAIQEVWDKQVLLSAEGSTFAGTMAISRQILTAAQVPSDTLYALHETISAFARRVCDKLHLTDANIAYITKCALEMHLEVKKQEAALGNSYIE